MFNTINFLFLGTIGWGISLYLIKILLPVLTPVEIVLYRMLLGAITLISLAVIFRLKINHFRHLIIDGLVLGIFNMSLPFYLTTLAEEKVSSALASIINGLTPLFAFLLAVCYFDKNTKINAMKIISLLLGLLGIILVNAEVEFNLESHFEILALIGAAMSYGVAANYVKSFSKTKEPILVAGVGALFSSLIMLAFKFSTEESLSWHLPEISIQLLALLWLGIVGSGICLYLYCLLIQRMGAFTATMVTYLMTITGVLAGILFLQETISGSALLGCVAIISSLILINHGEQLQIMLQTLLKKMNLAFIARG